MTLREFQSLGGKACARKLGRKGLRRKMTRAINIRWKKYRAAQRAARRDPIEKAMGRLAGPARKTSRGKDFQP